MANTLEIIAKVKADVGEAQKSFQTLAEQFKGLKLGSDLSKELDKEFSRVQKSFTNYFQKMDSVGSGRASVSQLEDMRKASQDLDKSMSSLIRTLGSVSDKDLARSIDVSQFSQAKKEIDALAQTIMGKFSSSVKTLQDAQVKLGDTGKSVSKPLQGLIESLSSQNLEGAKTQYTNLVSSIDGQTKKLEKSIDRANEKLSDQKLEGAIAEKNYDRLSFFQEFLKGDDINKIQEQSEKLQDSLNTIQNSTAGKKLTADGFFDQFTKEIEGASETTKQAQEEIANSAKGILEAFSGKGATSNLDAKASLFKNLDTVRNALKDTGLRQALGVEGVNTSALSGQITKLINQSDVATFSDNASALQAKINEVIQTLSSARASLGQNTELSRLFKDSIASFSEGDLSAFDDFSVALEKRISDLQKKMNAPQATEAQILDWSAEKQALEEFSKALETAFSSEAQANLSTLQERLGVLKESLSQSQSEAVRALANSFGELSERAQDGAGSVRTTNEILRDTATASIRAKEELGQVVSRFATFGTATGILRTFSNVVRQAFRSVKELDEAMNNIAVVTDYTTKDLWNQIDAYTSMAQATGSTIKGSYEVAQLYFQQGISEQEVMAATTETLKMARIANIDYASATDYATAAIKGFNLEYQDLAHISDVYSNLAAKTAADTEEISIAMSKVASIAHSTGMELETTAAFLTQIIATTREAPGNSLSPKSVA